MNRTYTAFLHWVISPLLMMSVLAQSSEGGASREVTLQLANNSQFELSTSVDTRTPSLGRLFEPSNVVLSGNIRVFLDLDLGDQESSPSINSIRLAGGDLRQTRSSLDYYVPPMMGQIEFDTTDLDGHLLSMDVPVIAGEFSTDSIQLVQNVGTATVGVPMKPPVVQNLVDFPVYGQFNDGPGTRGQTAGLVSVVRVSDSPSGRAAYQVDLTLPLAGQSLSFDHVGLPVAVDFVGGTVAASGAFVVPEPTSLMLTLFVAGWYAAGARRQW